jgi:hypothetical protein
MSPPKPLPIIGDVSERGLHRIDDELREDWIDAWVSEGLTDVESYLGKHAAFGDFLADRD